MAKDKVDKEHLIKISDNVFEIPQSFRADMRVPARVFANDAILDDILGDRSLDQLVNMTTLPGIVNYAYAMPDIHQGYGFPIGGVAALALNNGGVISPGGIGYDINCGVRLLVADITESQLRPHVETLATALYHAVPSGVGQGGRLILTTEQMQEVLLHGAHYMVEQGFGTQADLLHCEEEGRMTGGNPDAISFRARERGLNQLGTLGSGNHFLEIQKVDTIYDVQAATAFGLHEDAVTVMIHCGSRGLGHQTCTDYVRLMMKHLAEWGIELPDRELVCAPFASSQAQLYFSAMISAANFGWANRHLIGHWVRETWKTVLGKKSQLMTVYDVSHNIGKLETHTVNGVTQPMIVHRKGATRAFGPGRSEVPATYQTIGQPVLIPGTMGTASYVLTGTSASVDIAFGSSCHGAGRRMSRAQAKNTVTGAAVRKNLEQQKIIVRCDSNVGLAEEAPQAYKDIEHVVDIVQNAGLARKVVRLKPLAVIKGG